MYMRVCVFDLCIVSVFLFCLLYGYFMKKIQIRAHWHNYFGRYTITVKHLIRLTFSKDIFVFSSSLHVCRM